LATPLGDGARKFLGERRSLRYVRLMSSQFRLSSVFCLWRSFTLLRGLNFSVLCDSSSLC